MSKSLGAQVKNMLKNFSSGLEYLKPYWNKKNKRVEFKDPNGPKDVNGPEKCHDRNWKKYVQCKNVNDLHAARAVCNDSHVTIYRVNGALVYLCDAGNDYYFEHGLRAVFGKSAVIELVEDYNSPHLYFDPSMSKLSNVKRLIKLAKNFPDYKLYDKACAALYFKHTKEKLGRTWFKRFMIGDGSGFLSINLR